MPVKASVSATEHLHHVQSSCSLSSGGAPSSSSGSSGRLPSSSWPASCGLHCRSEGAAGSIRDPCVRDGCWIGATQAGRRHADGRLIINGDHRGHEVRAEPEPSSAIDIGCAWRSEVSGREPRPTRAGEPQQGGGGCGSSSALHVPPCLGSLRVPTQAERKRACRCRNTFYWQEKLGQRATPRRAPRHTERGDKSFATWASGAFPMPHPGTGAERCMLSACDVLAGHRPEK
mmetsp:Transcript_37795/g.93547  ORF Transcript_37795/g.93547 Transcript_37795/m.93547 type:complete len:231 (-) Transcript_37795:156-848(-)